MEATLTYHEITEGPGHRATQEQIARLYHRYHFARLLAEGKDVLEVACGSGLGLGYLASAARSVVGGDIDPINVKTAARLSGGRPNVSVRLLDAEQMDVPDQAADILLLFEALYYLRNVNAFLQEAVRVLRPGGKLVICTVNREWPDFHPSPKSVRYFAARELQDLLRPYFPAVAVYGSFPARSDSITQSALSMIKKAAVALHLIPKTLKGREWLKRFFYGALQPLPTELTEGMVPYQPPVEITGCDRCADYKILYVVGELGS